MRKIFILLLLLPCLIMHAQQGCIDCNVDSLARHLRASISDTDRLYTLIAITDGIIYPENPDSALHCVQHILSLNDRLKLIDPKPFILIREGLILWKKKEGDSAINKFINAITVFDEQKKIMGQYSLLTTIREFYNNMSLHEDRLKFYEEKLNYYQLNGPVENMAACFHGIAGFYYFKADYNQSIGYYLRSASVFKRFSRIGYGNEITVVGLMYSKWGNSSRALYYLKMADSLNRSDFIGREGNLELDKTEIAKISRQNHQFDQAFFYAREALNISINFHHPDNAAIENAELGGIYLQMNDPDVAIQYLKKARSLGDSVRLTIDGPRGPFECDFYWYQYYLQKHDVKNAETQLLIAYIKALRVKSNQLVLKYEKLLAGFYLRNNNFQKAIVFMQKYVQLNDSLNTIQTATSVAQYENEQREQINLDKIKIMKATEHSQRRYYLIAGAFLLLITAGLFSRIQYIRKTKKKLEEKNRIIEQEKLRAEQSEKFKEQFLANMSHEIRTPMNAVMGMTNLLIDKNPRHDQHQYLEGIKQSSDTLLHIINDILDLSKIEAGKIELEKIDFSIRDVLHQVVLTLTHKAEEKGLQLLTSIDKQVPDVLVGDPVRLNQILMNLTGNAIKFTEKGFVQITVKLMNIHSSSPPAALANKDNQAGMFPSMPAGWNFQFSISDTGIGIPKEKLQTIFESFSQAHSSDTRRFGGTGLGLSISKQLVELMGGVLHVESTEDSGATFYFELQLRQGSAERLQQRIFTEEEIDGTILNGLTILVVDDNEYNRIVATDTLKSKAKVEIVTASNGKEAIELVEQYDFDLVMMDVQMPVMNGFEATQYIRLNLPSPKKDIPIVALTASVLRTDLDKCRQAGMNSYIPKPFKAFQLVKGIAEVLGIDYRTTRKQVENKSEPSPQGTGYSVTDMAYLETFCEGDKERMKKYINLYLTAVPDFKEKLLTAIEAKDMVEIALHIHSFKPKWMMMGMSGTKDLAVEIDLLCNENNDKVYENVKLLIEQTDRSVMELADQC